MNSRNEPENITNILVQNLRKQWPGYYLMIPELNIPNGVVGLLGESGSGKSTLLNLLATLDTKYFGTLDTRDAGVSENDNDPDITRRKEYSFLFQSSNLISNFTVGQNLNLSRDIRSAVTNEDSTNPKDVISPLFSNPPNNLENKFPSELSGGEKQRVAVARALLKARDGAKLLFADEPTANIDKRTAEDCINELTGWARQDDNSLVVATHDLSIARNNTDYLALIGLAEGKLRESVITHYREIGVIESELPKAEDKVFTVRAHGPTDEIYQEIEDILLRRKQEEGIQKKPREAMPIIPLTDPSRTLQWASQLSFLLSYFYRDVFRQRELGYNTIRMLAVVFLFSWLILSASILEGVPRVADQIFKNDPLLRLIDIESIASFPLHEDTLQQISNLSPSDINKFALNSASSLPIIAGVVPRRDFACRFYHKSGMVQNEWINGGLWVYGVSEGEDPIFDFWNLAPLTEIDGIMVHEKLIVKLGFTVSEMQAKIDDPDQEAIIEIDVFEKVGMRVDQIVPRFPDPLVDMLIPAELANQIKLNEKEIATANVPFISFYGYPNMTAARKHQMLLQAKESQLKQIITTEGVNSDGNFYIQAERKPVDELKDSAPEFQIVIRPPNRSEGLPVHVWDRIVEIYKGLPNDEGRKSYPVKFEKLPSSISTLEAPPRDAVMGTIFVNEYRDIPSIIEYIEKNNDEFKVRITNKKSKETIATVQKGNEILEIVIGLINIAFTIISVLCLLFSFIPQVQGKLGEIGILRAYGSKRTFIYSRFLIEMVATCLVGFAAASALMIMLLAGANDIAIAQLPDLFANTTQGPLLYEMKGVLFSLIAGGAATILVLGLIYINVKKTPSELLRMAD